LRGPWKVEPSKFCDGDRVSGDHACRRMYSWLARAKRKGIVHVVSTLVLIFMFYVFKVGTKKPVVGMTGTRALHDVANSA